MENQHKKITGYRDLTQDEIDLMNRIKGIGVEIDSLVVDMQNAEIHYDTFTVDQRWVAIGKTHLQQGLMALVRAVAKPESF